MKAESERLATALVTAKTKIQSNIARWITTYPVPGSV